MRKVIEPFAESRNNYDSFIHIAAHLGVADEFTEGRSADEWIAHLFNK